VGRLYWIESGLPRRIAVAARPSGGDGLEADLRAWAEDGVRRVVSLLGADEAASLDLTDEPAACARLGLVFSGLPTPDFDIPPDDAKTRDLISVLTALPVADGIVIHCRGGLGRSPSLAAVLLRRLGLTAEAAMRQISLARGRQVPETPGQRRWIETFDVGV
jgi:protein-tyrosine phosphatase